MAGAKQRNEGVRRIGRRAGKLLLHTGTECEKNLGRSLIKPGETIRRRQEDRAVAGNAPLN